MRRDAAFTMAKAEKEPVMLKRETFKVARVFSEFPWLSKHVSAKIIEDVKISRIDLETMNRIVDRGGEEDILLVDCDGNTVTEVGSKYGCLWRWLYCSYWHPSPIKKNENIADAIIRIGEAASKRVVFILQIEHEYTGYAGLTIYKLPRAFPTIESWVAELKRRADNAVRQQIAQIDAEAVKK